MGKRKSEQLNDYFENAMNLSTSTDVEIKIGNEIIKAHKCILTKNRVFSRIFGNSSGAEIKYIDIPNVDLQVFKLYLIYLYTNKIHEEIMQPDLLYVAQKYGDEVLKKLCENYLSNSVNATNAVDYFVLGIRCKNELVKKVAQRFLIEKLDEDSSQTAKSATILRNNESTKIVAGSKNAVLNDANNVSKSIEHSFLFEDISFLSLNETRYSQLFWFANAPWKVFVRRINDDLPSLQIGLSYEGDDTHLNQFKFCLKLIPWNPLAAILQTGPQVKLFNKQNNSYSFHETLFWDHIINPYNGYQISNSIVIKLELSVFHE